MTSDIHDDISSQQDYNHILRLFDDNAGVEKGVESSKQLNAEGCDGISILYIDLVRDKNNDKEKR